MPLGERMKIARESIGKGQKEMAQLCGASYRMWQAYEVGENQPKAEVIEALVKLGFNANWLLTGEGEKRREDKPTVNDVVPGWNPSNGHPASKSTACAPELDLDLLEVIITEVVRFQKQGECEPPLVEMLARQTASTILNAYKVCHDLSLPASREAIRKFMSVAMNIYDRAMDKEREV